VIRKLFGLSIFPSFSRLINHLNFLHWLSRQQQRSALSALFGPMTVCN